MIYNWNDVVFEGRNEIVFKDRNKAYGAYLIRREYNRTVLIALFISTLAVGLLVAIPLAIRAFAKPVPIPKTYPGGSVVISPPPIEPKHNKVLPPVKPPPPKHLTRDRIRFHVRIVNHIDSVPAAPINRNIPTSTSNNTAITSGTNTNELSPIPSGGGSGKDIIGAPTKRPAPVVWVPVMPVYPGGESAMDKYIRNMPIPDIPGEPDLAGKVYVSFVVEADSTVDEVKILRGIAGAPEVSAQVQKWIQAMPKWSPGKQNGHPVPVRLSLPIKIN